MILLTKDWKAGDTFEVDDLTLVIVEGDKKTCGDCIGRTMMPSCLKLPQCSNASGAFEFHLYNEEGSNDG